MIVWIFLSTLVAFVETNAATLTSNAFRQYLRDISIFWLYGNFLYVTMVYALAGGVSWCVLWIFSWIKGRKEETFFTRNTVAVFGTLVFMIYGFWALRKFLYLRGILNLFGLALGTGVVVFLAGLLAWVFQRRLSPQFKGKGAAILILVTLAAPFVLRLSGRSPSENRSLPNVILLSVDTLRPDHLGFLGYEKARTPHIDRLLSQGVFFRHAYAQIPLTAPSFSSILTGLYPKTHGCRANLARLDPSVTTLAEVLAESGYRTAAFVSGYPLKRELCGLSKGFELYQDRFSFQDGFKLLRFLERFGVVELQLERRADGVSRLAIPWMEHQAKRPFFAWIHYYDAHVPYRPPLSSAENATLRHLRRHQRQFWGKGKEVVPSGTLQAMTALYDGEVAFVDEDIGRILTFLEDRGLRERTIILFVSDHGESFDHNYYFDHGDRLYESSLRVPVAFSYPGVVPQHVVSEKAIQSIDLFPTLLSLLGVPKRSCEGKSLFEKVWLLSETPSSPVYAELSRRPGYPTFGDLWSLRQGPWKLIYSPEGRPSELYNLLEDPSEINNLSSKDPERVNKMKEILVRWAGERKEGSGQTWVEGLTREKLKSLGYLQ